MEEIFKSLIEENFHQQIFDFLQEEIRDNYDEYDLTIRADVVQDVVEASLDNVDISRVYNINQDDDEVNFNILVSCDIEIGDYAYGENIPETIPQWFQLSCSAILKNAELADFSVDGIEAYNKQRE